MRLCVRLRDLSVLAILILGLVNPASRASAEDAFVLNRPLPKLESLLTRAPRPAAPTLEAKVVEVGPALGGDPFVLNRPTPKLESLVAHAPRHVIATAQVVATADPICGIFANGYDATGAAPCATCFDGVTDWDETDLDCGGAWCTACADGKQCLVNGDCISTLCNPGPHTRSPATCLDSVKDGFETGVDCGGSQCPTCANGQLCLSDTDCTDGWCRSGVCTNPVCNGVGCVYCNPTNPQAVCGIDSHCIPQPDTTSVCTFPAGLGTSGATCLSNDDCAGPLACVGSGNPLMYTCQNWCVHPSGTCPASQVCNELNPAAYIGSTEWGVCL